MSKDEKRLRMCRKRSKSPESIQQDSQTSITLEKEQLFEMLELLRETVRRLPEFRGSDWKDVDDWIFSELHLTRAEIEEIYQGRCVLVYTGSALEEKN